MLKTPEGAPVKMLSTCGTDKILKIEYIDVKRNSPELISVHNNVLKKIDVNFSSVDIVVHQDALMDIVDKVI